MKIISKRDPFKFYVLLIFFSILFLGLGSITMFVGDRIDNYQGYFIFSVFIVLTAYLNYVLITNSSKLVLNKKGVNYRNVFYPWEDIIDIKLTGKMGLFLNTPTECAVLTFKNSKPIIIFDTIYSNSSEMKYFIQEIIINKKEKVEELNEKFDLSNYNKEFFIPYKGNPVFSFRGIIMWSLILFISLPLLYSKKQHEIGLYLFIIGIMGFWFTFNALMMNYFEISENYLKVKNHYFFWKNKIFLLNNIKEVIFETQSKQPNCLKIITKDFKTKFYFAGSLTDSTWLEMKKEFELNNIIVRNECIPE